ncbi:hypothetical protein [Roseobacter sp. HKCCA0434]|uniref:hypothetical protein n=1 Tax=Roseobacter sp. HKCCA0434 TaxID=3079297 RepID=UPI002905B8E5|nr:hypothetical protein [Roseobacter sp. HKCCA0434]
MIQIAAALVFASYSLLGLLVLAIGPVLPGLPILLGCVAIGAWVHRRMTTRLRAAA